MGAFRGPKKQAGDRKYLSKNKSIKLYKQKCSKVQQFKEEVEALKKKYNDINSESIQTFDDFPLSERIRKGLKLAGYVRPTEIQKESIGLALQGHDILGAAKTGSGKTLAFVIPMLECLYCDGWSKKDGLGAIVITPTRELAHQIFNVLIKIGSCPYFSIGLVIGGKDLASEQKVLDQYNILICTPGRLKHHMDKNFLLNAANLKMLVLDEADRMLDSGFEEEINAILENLPTERQTLLFSATQTRSVKDLARLSLKKPVHVFVHKHAKHSTPENLKQNYLECEAHFKMNFLWSFIKHHKQQKVLVFMASCKQVKYMQESIVRLKPGVEIMALHGHLHQLRRMQIYDQFCRKNHVVMFATDVAARGLDFPNVNWVVQLDCPEDTNTYIHRAGRTARYQKNGESLLVLLPSEKLSMIEQLKTKKIPIVELKVNPANMVNVQRKLEAICARDVNLKNSAQRAFKSYIKNIALMKDKTVFDVTKIDLELYAKSLGLVAAPRVRFLTKKLKAQMNTPQNSLIPCESDDDSDDDLLKPKGAPELPSLVDSEIDESKESKKPITKAAVAKRVLKKKIKANIVQKFDEEGNPIREVCGKTVPVVASDIQNQILEEGYSIDKAKLMKEKEEEVDKILYKERIKQKHREERLKLKSKRIKDRGDAAQLADTDEYQDQSNSESEIDPNSLSLNYDDDDDKNEKEDIDDNDDDDEEEEEEEKKESYDEKKQQSDSVTEQSHSETEEELQNSKKRRRGVNHKNVKRQKKEKKFQSLPHSFDADEDLALHFLTNT